NANIPNHQLIQLRHHCGARRNIHVYTSGPTVTRAKSYGEQVNTIASGALNEQSEPEALEANAKDRVGALLYTSGTTGFPKGVMLSNKALLCVAEESAKIRNLGPND